MQQSPLTIANLLAGLRRMTGEAHTALLVFDGKPSAIVFGIAENGDVQFHSCGDSLTRALAEAHDHGRLLANKKGGAHEVPPTAKADEIENQDSLSEQSSVAGDEPAAELIGRVNAIKQYLGAGYPAMVEQLLKEIVDIAKREMAYRQTPPIALQTIVGMSAVVSNLPEIELKIADAKQEVRGNNMTSAENYLDAALDLLDKIDVAIFT